MAGSLYFWLNRLADGVQPAPLFAGRGFVFARPVGLLLSGYLLWLGASFRLLQNNPGGIIAAMAIVALAGALWHRQQVSRGQSPSLLAWLKQEWRYVLTVEVLFSLAFGLWVYYKAHNPNIETAGGEKWMEIAFLNAFCAASIFRRKTLAVRFGITTTIWLCPDGMITQLTGLSPPPPLTCTSPPSLP